MLDPAQVLVSTLSSECYELWRQNSRFTLVSTASNLLCIDSALCMALRNLPWKVRTVSMPHWFLTRGVTCMRFMISRAERVNVVRSKCTSTSHNTD